LKKAASRAAKRAVQTLRKRRAVCGLASHPDPQTRTRPDLPVTPLSRLVRLIADAGPAPALGFGEGHLPDAQALIQAHIRLGFKLLP